MSLSLDTVFMDAIESDDQIMEAIGATITTVDGTRHIEGGRRWCTSAAMPEDNFLANVDCPYIIISFNGLSSNEGTKDDLYDSGDDKVAISIFIAAKNQESLASLAARVRRIVHSYMVAHAGQEGIPYATQFSAKGKTYYEDKPCFGIELMWACDIDFDLTIEQDE